MIARTGMPVPYGQYDVVGAPDVEAGRKPAPHVWVLDGLLVIARGPPAGR